MILIAGRVHHGASPLCAHRRIARCPSVMRAIEGGCYGALEIGRPIQPPMVLWPKPLDLRLERGFDRPVRRLNGDHARPGIGDTASLADALDLRTLLREFASAQDLKPRLTLGLFFPRRRQGLRWRADKVIE